MLREFAFCVDAKKSAAVSIVVDVVVVASAAHDRRRHLLVCVRARDRRRHCVRRSARALKEKRVSSVRTRSRPHAACII